VLNVQYDENTYAALTQKILESMATNGEYGHFFPPSFSPHGYNETIAQEFYPLTKSDAVKRGFHWKELPEEMPKVKRVVTGAQLPQSSNDVNDEILKWAIVCEATGRPFRIIKQELDFYRQQGIPLPHLHPDERHRRRMAQRNPRKLWMRACGKCGKEMRTTYAPERPEIVYCESCYLAEVY
jgi:hypothetical protein